MHTSAYTNTNAQMKPVACGPSAAQLNQYWNRKDPQEVFDMCDGLRLLIDQLMNSLSTGRGPGSDYLLPVGVHLNYVARSKEEFMMLQCFFGPEPSSVPGIKEGYFQGKLGRHIHVTVIMAGARIPNSIDPMCPSIVPDYGNPSSTLRADELQVTATCPCCGSKGRHKPHCAALTGDFV